MTIERDETDLRAAARHIPNRSRPHRTPAPRLSPLPGRTRPETAARSATPSPPPSPTSSTHSSRRSAKPASNQTSRTCCGRSVNLFHRANERIERELDDNELAQKRSQKRPGWLRNPLGRTGAPHRRGHDADRAPQRHGVLPRPGRRTIRASHRLSLAARAAARW